jgi:hypothetical protein
VFIIVNLSVGTLHICYRFFILQIYTKYWGKCYRKDAAHKRDFLHPGDDDEEKKDKKTADSGI